MRNISLVTFGNLVGSVAIALALRCAHLKHPSAAPADQIAFRVGVAA